MVRPALVYFSTHICAERFTLDFRLELAVTGKEINLNPGVGAIPWGGHQPERVSFMPAAGAGEAAVGGLAGTLLGRD